MTDPEVGFTDRVPRASRLKLGAVVGGSLAIILGAAVAMGASPALSASGGATASSDPDAGTKPGRIGWDGDGLGRFEVGFRHGGITITAIQGSNLSLKTDDGWTRTIAVAGDTEITKAGETIALGDLAVGDQIAFRQTRNDDGTYTITRIAVVLPKVFGEVTAVTSSAITIETRDGSTVTVHVDGDTTYIVGGDEAALSDVEVGMALIATGEERSDGSLDAIRVRAGDALRGGHGFFGGGHPGFDDMLEDGSSDG
ncbi:MAG TPA: DUF5666 domain-containing protein [Candidatus Limnocylindrales bacterium]|nr:DUF5666 domain-containing protein [Candidatus Limnocylindrales bacterium]